MACVCAVVCFFVFCFCTGINPTLLRAVPVSAATFVVYEWVLDAFGR
jgi:hypothetical protein